MEIQKKRKKTPSSRQRGISTAASNLLMAALHICSWVFRRLCSRSGQYGKSGPAARVDPPPLPALPPPVLSRDVSALRDQPCSSILPPDRRLHTHQQTPAPPPLLPIVHTGTPEARSILLTRSIPLFQRSDRLAEI